MLAFLSARAGNVWPVPRVALVAVACATTAGAAGLRSGTVERTSVCAGGLPAERPLCSALSSLSIAFFASSYSAHMSASVPGVEATAADFAGPTVVDAGNCVPARSAAAARASNAASISTPSAWSGSYPSTAMCEAAELGEGGRGTAVVTRSWFGIRGVSMKEGKDGEEEKQRLERQKASTGEIKDRQWREKRQGLRGGGEGGANNCSREQIPSHLDVKLVHCAAKRLDIW